MMTDEEQKKIFSNNLNKYISLSGKQQKEVAEAVGTNPSTFNMWCKGNSMPGTGKIRAGAGTAAPGAGRTAQAGG